MLKYMNKTTNTTIKKTRAQLDAETKAEATKWDTFAEPIWENVDDKAYLARLAKADERGLDHCEICGRGVAIGKGWMVRGIHGGAHFLRVDQWQDFSTNGGDDLASDMGCWVLGPECGKKFPSEYRVRNDW